MMTERERSLSMSLAVALGTLGFLCATGAVVVAERGGVWLALAAFSAVAAFAALATVGKIVVELRRDA